MRATPVAVGRDEAALPGGAAVRGGGYQVPVGPTSGSVFGGSGQRTRTRGGSQGVFGSHACGSVDQQVPSGRLVTSASGAATGKLDPAGGAAVGVAGGGAVVAVVGGGAAAVGVGAAGPRALASPLGAGVARSSEQSTWSELPEQTKVLPRQDAFHTTPPQPESISAIWISSGMQPTRPAEEMRLATADEQPTTNEGTMTSHDSVNALLMS